MIISRYTSISEICECDVQLNTLSNQRFYRKQEKHFEISMREVSQSHTRSKRDSLMVKDELSSGLDASESAYKYQDRES